MATRAATFTAKIHTLSDYYFRTRHGILPLPSGIDLANTLKYFSQTLLSVLKDVPSIPMEMMRDKDQDSSRVALFPILDYTGLYHVVIQVVDIVPLIQLGVHVLGQSLLHTMICLVPFLEHHYIDTLPNLVASMLTTFPETLHQEIIETLCYHLLPFSIVDIGDVEKQSYATLSTSSILLTVFQYSKNPAHHMQIMECLMSFKCDVIKDLLCTIAHGTSAACFPAATLLFHYWPSLNPTPYDRRAVQSSNGWKPISCQRENCLNGDNNDAVQMCLDPAIAIGTGDHPPPLYVCQLCADQIRQETDSCNLVDIMLPVQQISIACENKNCRSTDKVAICFCFSVECTCYNGNRPTRYCSQCHSIRHNSRRGGDHIVHMPIDKSWSKNAELQSYVVEAVVSLLKEAQPIADKNYKDSIDHHIMASLLGTEEQIDLSILEERRMLSRFGIYLLVGVCIPDESTSPETLGRLLAMLFQWFDATAYLQDDQAGSILERLKSEFVHSWLMKVCKSHFEVFVSCLLPHPPDYARVGGHWDTISNRTGYIKEGFNRLFCLVPYEIISLEVWDYVMGHWMEAIRREVSEEELPELKMLLSKVLDPEMSPLGFDAHQMYKFFAVRFQQTKPEIQEQALLWLQILCKVDVVVPLSLVFSMFNDGIQSVKTSSGDVEGRSAAVSKVDLFDGEDIQRAFPLFSDLYLTTEKRKKQISDSELILPCFVLMMDVLLKQMELQEIDPHLGLEHIVSREAFSLVHSMTEIDWVGNHTCNEEESLECSFCETLSVFYQLAKNVLEYVCPVIETSLTSEELPAEESHAVQNTIVPDEMRTTVELMGRVSETLGLPRKELDGQQDKGEFESSSILPMFTATVQTVIDAELQTVAIIPTEEVVRAVANAVTLTETDVGAAKVSVAQATIVDENEQLLTSVMESKADEEGTFWNTSEGKFKFTLDELPTSLQLIYLLLKRTHRIPSNSDASYYMIGCLEVLCFNGDCLNKAAKEHRGFLIWCLENQLINRLWDLLQSEVSYVGQVCAKLLLHCLTFASGADTFWKLTEQNFHHNDWKVRFSAVEKVTMIARFLGPDVVHSSPLIQSSLANAFSYLISSLDDISPYVAQRASIYLDTIPTSSLKSLCLCLEIQFDLVIVDRPMILQTLYQLYNCLPDRAIFSWEFFLNRFETLFLEAQVSLERTGDIVYPRDLRFTNITSDSFTQKMSRVHEALRNSSLNHNVRSLSVSLGSKLRYKRALSAPGGMTCKQERIVDKEKVFSRQSSAPVLKRKSSKFGVASHAFTTHFPNHLFPDGHLKDQMHDDHSFLSIFHRFMEMEDHDQDTVHLLVFLLMQFLAEPSHAFPSEEKPIARVQNLVLRHLNLLLGFSPQEKGFCITPGKMRSSPIFSCFLSNLPRVLDCNFKMATVLLPICVPLLLYCVAPLRTSVESPHLNYSLWCLESRLRHSWLVSVCILLYKFSYDSPPLTKQILSLARIVLNTLASHRHKCKHPVAITSTNNLTLQSKETSISAAELGSLQERDTPPYSPRMTMEGVIVTITAPVEGKVHYQKMSNVSHSPLPQDEYNQASDNANQWNSRRTADFGFSNEADDAEPELEAIPESPKSEMSLVDSPEGSVEDIADDIILSEKIGRNIVYENSVRPSHATVIPHIVPDQDVEFKMAQELKAFDSSFEKVSAGVVTMHEERPPVVCIGIDSFSSSVDDSEDIFVRQMTVHSDSVFIAKLVTNDKSFSSRGCPLSTSTSSAKSDTAGLEVLDASRLENRVVRREPPVVSQEVSHIPSYLFQPIHSHPVTALDSKVVSEECQPIKVEAVRKSSVGDSSIMLPTVPSPERLLPIGRVKTDVGRQSLTTLTTRDASVDYSEEKTGGKNSFDAEPATATEAAVTRSSVKGLSPEDDSGELVAASAGRRLQQSVEPQQRKPLVGSKDDMSCYSNEMQSERELVPLDNHTLLHQQRLYPGSFKRLPDHQHGKSMGSSPRQLSRTFDTHFEALRPIMDSVGLDCTAFELATTPAGGHYFQHGKHEMDENYARSHFRQKRQRKTGTLIEQQKLSELRNCGSRKSRKGELNPVGPSRPTQRCSSDVDLIVDRCPECGAALEQYSDEELGLCIVTLATFVHREPVLVASLLPEILHAVSRIASSVSYSWELESTAYLPGNARSVARQFLRCVLHQLSSSGVFVQIFQSSIEDAAFFKSMALALSDFSELNPMAPLQLLLEAMNERKSISVETLVQTTANMATYMDCLQLETSAALWANILPQFDSFFRKLALILPTSIDVNPVLRIICNILRIQGLNSFKAVLDPFAKIVSFSIQNCYFKYQTLLDLCHLCNRAFTKERDKLYMTKTVVFELVQSLKFKTNIPDENLLKLVQFIIQDSGGILGPSIIVEDIGIPNWDIQNMINTSASECMRQYFTDALDFVADVHTLGKVKSNFKGTLVGLNEDTLGGTLKAGVAQYLAVEITRGNSRENRAITRYLPWLYNPLPAIQQGPKEFIDCVMHVRLLSWLLVGSLIHMVVVGSNSNLVCQPIPLEANSHLADHIQVILTGFAEQSKVSVIHMSSLFHAFILCQLWTMYCEQLTLFNLPGTEHYNTACLTLSDFWAKVTPGVLQLLSHSRVLAEMVSLHFLSLIEALIECNSTILAKLFPVWRPVLCSYHSKLPGHLVVRLQACENRAPPVQCKDEAASISNVLLKWVQRLQFKLGQVELQSSAATQFYSV